ncbi:MAG: TonB-dependent receptor [Leptospiraceae bacterium]|nr:TonB-dependent receptor [Leptospiraceae bacterium]
MMKYSSNCLAILFTLFSVTKIFSQVPPNLIKPKTPEITNEPKKEANSVPDTIVITGSRRETRLSDSTIATEVIGKKRIEQTGARNVGEVLENQLGLDVVPFFGGTRVRMLGLDSQYVLFLLDSERIAGRIDNSVDLSRFKTQNIERIEIVKGASSALYGADAMGGVINIITREPSKDHEYEFRTTYGSGRKNQFGTAGDLHSTANVGFKKEMINLNLSTGFNKSPGYRFDPSSEASIGNAFKDINTAANFTINPNGKLRAKGRTIYNNREQNGVDVTETRAVFDRENLTNDFLGVGILEYDFGKKNRISFRGNYSKFENKFTNTQRLSNEPPRKELTANSTSQGTVQLDYELNQNHYITVGAESYADELESDRISSRFTYRTRRALFLQDEWKFLGLNQFRIIPGVRYDDDSIFGNKTTPKLAFRYDILKNLIWRASYGRGFRPPSFQDLFLRFENPSVGYVVEGNPNLRPEKSITVNTDLEYTPKSWATISLSFFRNDLEDLLQYRLLTGNRGELSRFQLINISRAYTRGGEFALAFRFWKYYQMEFGYNHTDTKDMTNDRPLDGRALHQGIFNFTYTSPFGLEIFLRGRRVDRRPYYRDTNQFTNTGILSSDNPERDARLIYGKPYTFINLRVEQKIGENFSVFAGVENILDVYEERFNPIRPKFYYTGLTAKF